MSGIIKFTGVAALAFCMIISSGCMESDQGKGALIGGALGTAAGAIIGHQSGKGGQGALIGGAAGAVTGGLIGAHRDKQKLQAENEELKKELQRSEYEKELERLRAENERLRNSR